MPPLPFPQIPTGGQRPPELVQEEALELVRRRFSRVEEFSYGWDARGAVAADMLGDIASVCEIGCGPRMPLKSLLKSTVAYHPADLVSWSHEVAQCDLARGVYPGAITTSEATVMLGVMQYLPAPEHVLFNLASMTRRVLFDYITDTSAHRDDPTWITRWSYESITGAIQASGWRIASERELQPGHPIFDLRL